MKKLIILITILFLVIVPSYGQIEVGINVLPGISTNRVSSDSDSISFDNDGVGYKISLGLLLDFELKENYYFSTGIYWFPERIGIKATLSDEVRTQSYNLQYIQLPFNLKLLTDEFSIDKKVFFQLGLAFQFKLNEKGNNLNDIFIDKFNFYDIKLDFGVGLEMKVGQNTTLITGITYYRGLVNAIKPNSFLKGDLSIKNDYYALNLGVKF